MSRLLVHVEGQTEETFVDEVLRDHLVAKGYSSVSARIVGNARHFGGIRPWQVVKKEIIRHLREDSGCISTTLVDYYALPESWPGRAAAPAQKVGRGDFVENHLLADVVETMGSRFNPSRFVPFGVMHEFEGLLFSDCAAFSQGIGRPDLQSEFEKIRSAFDTPEDINDSKETAPSKRISALLRYEKPLMGNIAVLEIGLHRIRQECPHFNEWISRLEAAVADR